MSTTWDSLFKQIENDIGKAMVKVSRQVSQIWQELLQQNFYDRYEPQVYKRTYETLASIKLIDISKKKDGYEITIGYDEDLINTYYYEIEGRPYKSHGIPEIMGELVEYGFTMRNGQKRKGAYAFHEMISYAQSDDFLALFGAEMKKLGYMFKY